MFRHLSSVTYMTGTRAVLNLVRRAHLETFHVIQVDQLL